VRRGNLSLATYDDHDQNFDVLLEPGSHEFVNGHIRAKYFEPEHHLKPAERRHTIPPSSQQASFKNKEAFSVRGKRQVHKA